MDNEPKGNNEPIVEDAIRQSDPDHLAEEAQLKERVEEVVMDKAREDMQAASEQIIRDLNEINERFKHHVPTQQQIVLMEDLAKMYAYLAKMILALCPRCADRTHAIRQLQDSKMWANTSIMLEGKI
jgi:hypothetical protein